MKVVVQHNLSEIEAKSRIQSLINQSKINYSNNISAMSEKWESNTGFISFYALGFKAGGTILISGNRVILDIRLPLPALAFQNKIKIKLVEEIRRSLI